MISAIPELEFKNYSVKERLSTSDGVAFIPCSYFCHFHLHHFDLCRISWNLLYGQTQVGLPKKLKQSMCRSYCSDSLFGAYWPLRWQLVCSLCRIEWFGNPTYFTRRCYLVFLAYFVYENRAIQLPTTFLHGLCCPKEACYFARRNVRQSFHLCGGE